MMRYRHLSWLPLLSALLTLGMVAAPGTAHAGLWRFEGNPGDPVGVVPNATPADGMPNATGSGTAIYSALIPGALILDPLTGLMYANTSSLAMGAGSGLVTALDNAVFDAATSFTIEAFVRLGSSPGATYPAYVARRYDAGGGSYRGWQLDKSNTHAGRARVDTSSAQNQVVTAGTMAADNWYHTALSYDATTGLLKYYFNYTTIATATLSGYPGTSSQLSNIAADLVMGSASADWGTNAAVDEVRLTPLAIASQGFLRTTGLSGNYQMQVGSASGNASLAAYISPDNLSVGTPLVAMGTGTPTRLATGTVGLSVGVTNYLQVVAGGGWDSQYPPNSQAPWLATTLTAPLGYVFAETGNQFFSTSTATWSAQDLPWGTFGASALAVYGVPSPNPAMSAGFAPNAQAIFALDENQGNVLNPTYFSAPFTLQQGAWTVLGAPEQNPGTPQGLSAHIVRVRGDIVDLAGADAALALRPGVGIHDVSQVLSIARADIDTGGNYANQVGLLAGAYRGGGSPDDYAMRVAGYIYAEQGETRTFAVRSDEAYYFKIGGTELLRYSGAAAYNDPTAVAITFPAAGYYPLELVWTNYSGAGYAEISSSPGYRAAWDSTNFVVLGNDPNYPVYQNPGAMPNDFTGTVAESAGPAFVPGAIQTPTGDGFVFRVVQDAAAAPRYNWSGRYLMDNYEGGTPAAPVVTKIVDYYDPQSGSTGNFNASPVTAPWPHNTAADDNEFAARASGLIYFDQPGIYSFATGSDDSFRLRIGKQVIGERLSGTATGDVNMMYINIPQAGLYPIELTYHEGTGGSSLEFSHGGFGVGRIQSLLVTSRNANTAGFNRDFGAQVYSVEPIAELTTYSTTLQAKVLTNVPALNGGTQLPVERWALQRLVRPTIDINNDGIPDAHPGLWASYYIGGSDVGRVTLPDGSLRPNSFTGARQELTSGVFNYSTASKFGYGLPINPFGDTVDCENYFHGRWTGYLYIPTAGTWSFHTNADDYSWIYLDIDGNGDFLGANEQPVISGRDARINNVALGVGWYKAVFMSREEGGAEDMKAWWSLNGAAESYIPAQYFAFVGDLWQTIASSASMGLYQIGDLASFGDVMAFDFGSTETLRLSVDIAGAIAIYEATFTFVPEPGTLVLLAGGLLAAATRRRRSRR
ncbi:MAG TPA: PEP-CTERM sorting domain-containing protein [Planctomycetota bacterium]|nr:PEP-CTERM sorting domain-containing protein [Planctomycetota bacterium]HRT94513.1 PEP-CTERM sorting domain-containing protein [Planctomycetota bacterium]